MRTIRLSRTTPWLVLVALLAIGLAACAGSSGAALSPVGSASGQDGGGGVPSAAPAAPVPGATDQPETGDGTDVGARDDAKIIRTGTMELEVSDVPGALVAARDRIRSLGGYIGASSTSNEDDQPYADITYRIPADRWEEALDTLRGLGGLTKRVVTEHTEALEVTGQVLDLEARIRNLRASETALQGIAAQATRVSDILEVQSQLTNVRGQIEQLEAQRTGLVDRAAFATLTVTFRMPVLAVEAQSKGWDPGAIADEASASLISVLQALAGAGIWFAIVWLPVLVTLGLVITVFAWILRRLGLLRRPVGGATPGVAGE